MRTRKISIFVLALFMFLLIVTPAFAKGPKKVAFAELFYDGEVVRTVVPPAKMTKPGLDNIYAFPGDAADGQRPVAAVAPGDQDYHGGKWALHFVSWNVDPYVLTSEAEVLAAADSGDISIERVPEGDFKCPIQP